MILGMELVDFFCIGAPLGIGLCFGKLIPFGILGLAIFSLRRKLKKTLPKHYVVGLIYWHLR